MSDSQFERLKILPFSDGTFATTGKITEPITKALAKQPDMKVTVFPVLDHKKVPSSLLQVIEDEFNHVVKEGLTYPYDKPIHGQDFIDYWFKHFVAIMIAGEHKEFPELDYEGYKQIFLGNFYVKPNYVGRSSHVCNGGFIVNHEKRGLGLGVELGKIYLQWAPQLGYVYSVFNLVFETNTASVKIWDSLGFERIGYVKNVAVLKGINRLVGAHIYGKDLV